MNSINDIIQSIKAELYIVKPDLPKNISVDDNLVSEWGLASLDMVELVARIEEKYRIPIDDSEWDKLRSIQLLASYIYSNSK